MNKVTYIKPAQLSQNWTVSGTYEGTARNRFGRDVVLVKDRDGNQLGINATDHLTKLLKGAEVGDVVCVTYGGTTVSGTPKRKVHLWAVNLGFREGAK